MLCCVVHGGMERKKSSIDFVVGYDAYFEFSLNEADDAKKVVRRGARWPGRILKNFIPTSIITAS